MLAPVPAALFEPVDDQSSIVLCYDTEFSMLVSCGLLQELNGLPSPSRDLEEAIPRPEEVGRR